MLGRRPGSIPGARIFNIFYLDMCRLVFNFVFTYSQKENRRSRDERGEGRRGRGGRRKEGIGEEGEGNGGKEGRGGERREGRKALGLTRGHSFTGFFDHPVKYLS